MIALLIQLAIAASVLLSVASPGFWGDTGRSLRHATFALFGTFAFSLVLSPIAYLVLRAHRCSGSRPSGQAKRLVSDQQQATGAVGDAAHAEDVGGLCEAARQAVQEFLVGVVDESIGEQPLPHKHLLD